MKLLYNKIIFIISIVILVVLFFYNIIMGNKGSYMDHSKLILNTAVHEIGYPLKGSFKRKSRESAGEAECRRVIENLTGKSFPKKRPDFLRNEITRSNLEIDCYCDELKLGIEYNGPQHYYYNPHFHASKDAFYNSKYRDELKARLCAKNGVKLIVVPYTVDINDIEDYIRQRI